MKPSDNSDPQVVLVAKNDTIGSLVRDCAEGKIKFDSLCEKVAAMGYKTTSLYEMVIAAEAEIRFNE